MFRIILILVLIGLYQLLLATLMGILKNDIEFKCCTNECKINTTEEILLNVYYSVTLVCAAISLFLRCYNLPASFSFLQDNKLTTGIAIMCVATTFLFCNQGEKILLRIQTNLSFYKLSAPNIIHIILPIFWVTRAMNLILYYMFAISESITVCYNAPLKILNGDEED